jgi:hypothetical protein
MQKTAGSHVPGTKQAKTIWYCPLEKLSSDYGQQQQCQHTVDLVKVAARCGGPYRTEELRKMEFGRSFDAAIETHLQEHLQSIGLIMERNVSVQKSQ